MVHHPDDADLHQAADDFQIFLAEIARLRQVERRYNHVGSLRPDQFGDLWSISVTSAGSPEASARSFDRLMDQGMG